jgi:excinuclease ABC subunit C
MLKLDDVPARIECFDISHTAGEKTVASCVVFDQNGPLKSDYRSLNISNITGGDDYAAMEIALNRRYSKIRDGDGKLPDLVLIDGGKGQLHSALNVMDELQIADIRLAAISKGRERKPGNEQIWVPETDDPVEINETALLLLQQIRDEAHRFALMGHRGRRNNARKKSILEDVPGIGQRRRSNLLKHFGGLQGIANAGIEELEKVPGISPILAEKIHCQLHEKQ